MANVDKGKLIAYCDTETLGFEGEAVCFQYLFSMNNTIYSAEYKLGYDCWIEAVEAIIKEAHEQQAKSIRLVFHNAAFDMLRLHEQLPKATTEYILSGSSFIMGRIVYEGVEIEVRDSLALLPSSLEKLGKSFGFKKLEHDHEEEFDGQNPKHIEYALNDVIILKGIIDKFASIVELDATRLPPTTSGLAMRLFNKQYKKANGKQWQGISDDINRDIYKNMYFGGRVILNTYHKSYLLHNTMSLDVTSSYPAAMADYKYPKAGIDPKKICEGVDLSKLGAGVWIAKIFINNYATDLPVIPRKKDKDLCYPIGSFLGTITSIEYEYLKNKHEYLDIQWLGGYFYAERFLDWHLRDYIEVYYKLKLLGDEMNNAVEGSGDALRTVGKLLQNGLYGKFAQKYEQDDPLLIAGKEVEEVIDNEEDLELAVRRTGKDHRNAMISALITAAGRVKLYEAVDFYGAANVIYCDTDSVKIKLDAYFEKGAMENENDSLGGWKNEGEYLQLHVHAPKVYSALVKGKAFLRAKGISLNNNAKIDNIVCDNKKPEKFITKIRKELIANNEVLIYYTNKPLKIRSHAREILKGNVTYTSNQQRSVTKRKNVNGYKYIEETNQFTWRIEND